jgi:putative transposase
MEVPVSGRR